MSDDKEPAMPALPTYVTISRHDLANAMRLTLDFPDTPENARLKNVFLLIAYQLQAAGAESVRLDLSFPDESSPNPDGAKGGK